MRYFLFMDESGEANIDNPDPRFNIFVLCGVLFREDHYRSFNDHLSAIKRKIFGDEFIVFHSYEMRNQTGDFVVFKDKELLKTFYAEIEKLFRQHNYKIFASIINKEKYKKRYPDKNQAYEDSIKFITERCISELRFVENVKIYTCIEKRNEGKNRYVKKYYNNFRNYGSEFCSSHDYLMFHETLAFRGKNDHINGLEFADLCAYPIAWQELNSKNKHPTYELFKSKIGRSLWGNVDGYGLKRFP